MRDLGVRKLACALFRGSLLPRPLNRRKQPTMRKRTSAPDNARNRSTKSGFIAELPFQAPEFFAETPGFLNPLVRWDCFPELAIAPIVLGH